MQTSLSSYFKRAPLSPSCGAVPPLAKRARITAATIQQEVGDSSVDGVKVEEGWKEVIAPETQKAYFQKLKDFLRREELKGKPIYPPKSQVFRAFDLSPWEKTKVVIIGQDPYHGAGQANGLAFSVGSNVRIPPSLKNILREAENDVGIPKAKVGSLEPWARQGVLLLNTVLTVTEGMANSHKNQGWERFTDAVIAKLNKEKKNLVFFLWGKPAQMKGSFVDKSRHCVIASSHPSPLGATKTSAPFLGSKCFSRANAYLLKTNQEPVDWKLD